MDNSGSISIGLATPKDIQGILAIQEENQPEHGGQLSVRMSKEWFEKALSENSVIVARDQGLAICYIVSTSIAAQAHIPIVQASSRHVPVGRPTSMVLYASQRVTATGAWRRLCFTNSANIGRPKRPLLLSGRTTKYRDARTPVWECGRSSNSTTTR
jgi:hypothetical protein